MPFFSIIIPLYNKANSIAQTLHSVINQNFRDYEIIIINDGSTDQSEEAVHCFDDDRIRYILTENQGVSKARNLGIQKAKGTLIAFLDADDYWYPNHLDILATLYQKFPEAGLYTTSYEKRFNSKSTHIVNFKNIDPTGKRFMIIDDFFDSSLIDPIAWTSACAVPKRIIDILGAFDISITHGAGEDTDLWIRIALRYNVVLATFITATYHLDATNRISNTNTLQRSFIDLSKFEKEEKQNISLKNYLDQNRFAISLQYRMAGDHKTAKKYRKEIDFINLNTKQKILIRLPKSLLLLSKKIQTFLILKAGIKLSSFT
ncbi:glycosyltransferase family 2 protein [Aquimarina addita]|uniref:Glycosyltransferase family 2 protein n=1 Tax=Aquimarina addita TaxID=870485 RepID=A0ABP7XBM1_9FLAO